MAQFSTSRNKLLSNGDDIYEVVMISGQAGPSIYVPGGNLNASTDAFGRVRQSTPYTLFDSYNINDRSEKYDYQLSGAGQQFLDSDQSAIYLTVTDASGDEVIEQSYRNFSYQPGKSLLILSTMVFNEPKTNLRQRTGYFDENDGVYLEQDGNDIYIVLRSSVNGGTERRIPQANWNGDKLDGTGPSFVNLDLSKSQIFWTDIEWLGVGSVRCGVVINGQFILAHVFHNANIYDNVYMKTPNLPVRREITNTGATSGASTLKSICASVMSEGGYEARAKEHVASTALAGNTMGSANTWTNLVTIKANRSGIIAVPSGVDLLSISNDNFEWALFYNAVPATAFNWQTDINNMLYSTEVKTFSDIGDRIAGGYFVGKSPPISFGNGSIGWDYQLGEDIDNTVHSVTLAARGTQSKSAAGMIKWVEL